LETGSVRLFKQLMKGKGYPYRPPFVEVPETHHSPELPEFAIIQ